MKHIKLFENKEDFNSWFNNGNFVFPNIYSMDDKLSFNTQSPSKSVILWFEGQSATLANYSLERNVEEVIVDGIPMNPINYRCSFESPGVHKVEVVLNDNTIIDDNLFYGSTASYINLPSTIVTIGNQVFRSCENLKHINIPKSVTSIETRAFMGCESLKSITIPSSITSIESMLFYNCTSLQSIVIPNSVTSMGDDVFYGCESLESITIPNSVTSLGDSIFDGCESLKSIIIGNGITSISRGMFESCSSLTEITSLALIAPTLERDVLTDLSPSGILKYPKGSDYSTWIAQLPSGWTTEEI